MIFVNSRFSYAIIHIYIVLHAKTKNNKNYTTQINPSMYLKFADCVGF